MLCKRGIPSVVNFLCCSRVKYQALGPWVRWVCSKYCRYTWVLKICFHIKLLMEYLLQQSCIWNKFCHNCLFVTRQVEDRPTLFTVCNSLSLSLSLSLSRSWFRRMRCANVRVSALLRLFHLQVLPHYQPIPAFWTCLPWVEKVGLIISLPKRDLSIWYLLFIIAP